MDKIADVGHAQSQTLPIVDGLNAETEAKAPLGRGYPTPSILPDPQIGDSRLPLISLITPSFNQGQFVQQTIESVLSQDYPKLDYWVVDGGSSDDTLRILRQYEHDPRLRWLSEPDAGQSDAINKGLARCQGEICAWLNSDDVLLPGALRSIGEAWQAAEAPVILYGLGRHIDTDGRDLGYCPAQSAHMRLDKLLWIGKNALVQPATFVPTLAFREAGGLDVTRHYAIDLDLWLRLAERLPLQFVARDLALYRLHPASKTVASPTKFIEECRLILEAAAGRGLLSLAQAHSRAELFGLRTCLMPGSFHFGQALRYGWSAVKAEPAVLPEAVVILLKAAVRLIIGDRLWSLGRLAKARVG